VDEDLIWILIICGIVLTTIPLLCFSIFSEVKKIRQEMVKIEFSINQMKSSLAHQTSKLEMMNKHLAIIGSKAAPERYKKIPSGKG
jgi:hypothetical protein